MCGFLGNFIALDKKKIIICCSQNHASAWPFLDPVPREEVPDYYDVIKYPMG